MKILKTVVGPIQTNCYFLYDETTEGKPTAIIDPGDEADRLVALLRRDNLTPVCVLLTHGHPDHVTGLPGILGYYPDLPVYIHEADAGMVTDGDEFSPGIGPVSFTYYKEDDVVAIGKLNVTVIETPGHTPGSVCLKVDDRTMFTGDTLFQNSCGRTDLPGGDHKALMRSLNKLVHKMPDCAFYPGHMLSSSMAQEFQHNIFILNAMRVDL